MVLQAFKLQVFLELLHLRNIVVFYLIGLQAHFFARLHIHKQVRAVLEVKVHFLSLVYHVEKDDLVLVVL